MTDHAVAILDKTDATLNVRDTLGCWVENDLDVVVGHEIGNGFKFGVHMKMCDGEARCVADAEGLIKGIAK